MKAVSAPGVRAAAKTAKEAGETRFTWNCSLHGDQPFYSSSAACPRCTVERKDKLHQREYNRRVASVYPHVKNPETGRYTRKKVTVSPPPIGLAGVEDTPPGVLIGRVKSKG